MSEDQIRNLHIDLSDAVLDHLGPKPEAKIRFWAAALAYELHELTAEQAALLAGLPLEQFLIDASVLRVASSQLEVPSTAALDKLVAKYEARCGRFGESELEEVDRKWPTSR